MNDHSTDIVLYLHVHQPYRVRNYTIFDTGHSSDYFNAPRGTKEDNLDILNKVSDKSYLPTCRIIQDLLDKHPEFTMTLSISGLVLEQLRDHRPDVLSAFEGIVSSGRVEVLGETYDHSLAFFYNLDEFESQVRMHSDLCEELLNYKPHSFRNTELAYNNDLGAWCDQKGYEAVLAEGWDTVLGWRSPNFVYKPLDAQNTKLLLKNYKLSDDIAFRFGNKSWTEWPLSVPKFIGWTREHQAADVINLFMDFETFGEHQWADTGILEFLSGLPGAWLSETNTGFMTVSQAARSKNAHDGVSFEDTVTWADSERDLSAWTGNSMQRDALKSVYQLSSSVLSCGDKAIISDWRKLQASDHFYYMSTKWWNDGDVHAYFSPYSSPYEAQMNFMNALLDLKSRLSAIGKLQ